MIFYQLPLDVADDDGFIMPVSAGPYSLLFIFRWPEEIQRAYDVYNQTLDNAFRSIPYFKTSDTKNTFHIPFNFGYLDMWQQYLNYIDAGDIPNALNIVNLAPWPWDQKTAVLAFVADTTNRDLYNITKSFITSLAPVTDEMKRLNDDLVWSVMAVNDDDRRVFAITPNAWIFQGAADYKLYFKTEQENITRNNLSQVTMFIGIGDEDV